MCTLQTIRKKANTSKPPLICNQRGEKQPLLHQVLYAAFYSADKIFRGERTNFIRFHASDLRCSPL